MTDEAVKEAVVMPGRGTKAKFAAMIGICFAGTLNDNFYRQGAMLLAVAGGMAYLQTYIMVLFIVPFIVFAAYAGYLSDRFSKRSIVIAAKLLSVVAFVAGAIGLYIMSWPIILATVFIIGAQAAAAAALALMGIAGGVFLVPVTSFVQVRPAPQEKGRMIASSNLADFVGIMLSGVVFYVFSLLRIKPSNCFAIEALMVIAVAGWLMAKLPRGNEDD